MKLAIMSDLHIDLNHFEDFETQTLLTCLKNQEIDWLHLAGDISNKYFETSLPFLNTIAEQVNVTYNLGNHDMLNMSEKQIEELDFQIYDLGDNVFLAFHGWYDYSFSPEKTETEHLAFKNRFWFDRRLKRPLSDPELTKQLCSKLENILANQTKPIILAMHFVPHDNFLMTHNTFKPFNAFLGSRRFHQIFTQYEVTDVIFGHAHRSYGTQTIDGIRYHSRPLGYIREWDLTINYVSNHPELNPTGTWNLSKRYNLIKKLPDFQAYKEKELAKELTNSMTIFDI